MDYSFKKFSKEQRILPSERIMTATGKTEAVYPWGKKAYEADFMLYIRPCKAEFKNGQDGIVLSMMVELENGSVELLHIEVTNPWNR